MDHAFHAMQLDTPGAPLRRVERAMPTTGDGEIRIAVTACGMCRTDLHIADGDIIGRRPIIPGHEIVGRVDALGLGVTRFGLGDRVGVPWLGRSCGACPVALRVMKISATRPSSPASRATAASRRTSSPMRTGAIEGALVLVPEGAG